MGAAEHTHRRTARSLRHAGDHPHHLPGAIPANGRAAGDVSAGDHPALGAGRTHGARLLVFRRQLCLCAVRRGHGSLLGPLAGAGIVEPDPVAAARHGAHQSRPGCHRRGLDLPVRAGRPQRAPRPRGAARAAGLVPQVRAEDGCRCRRGGHRGWHGEAVSGGDRSGGAGEPRHRVLSGPRGHRSRQQRDRRLGAHAGRNRADGARQRLPAVSGGFPLHPARFVGRHSGAARRGGAYPARPRDAPGHLRTRRRGRGRGRRDHPAQRQERPLGHRRGEGKNRRAAGLAARGRRDRDHLRPQPADRPRHREPAWQADRGVPDRDTGVRAVPVAPALGAGGSDHPAARYPRRLHRDAPPRRERQHHVARRYRHRHRGHGRCRDRDDRERPQAHRVLAARQPGCGTVWRHALATGERGLGGGGTGAVQLAADHHAVLRAGVHARGPGGATVRAARFHQELCHGRRGDSLGNAGAGTDGLLDSRPAPGRGPQPAEPLADTPLPAPAGGNPATPRAHAAGRAHGGAERPVAAVADGQRIPAAAGRR